MRASLLVAAVGLVYQAVPGLSALSRPPTRRKAGGVKQHNHPNPELVSNGTFDQLIDHNDPSKGTFKQRYWWDGSNWKGPGSPIFIFNPGEEAADGFTGYLDNGTMPGLYAQEFDGAVILIER